MRLPLISIDHGVKISTEPRPHEQLFSTNSGQSALSGRNQEPCRGRTCATPTGLVGKGKPPEPAFTCVCRNSAMPGARRGSPWRAPSGHMARGSHMCDPYGVADEGKPPVPAFTCVYRDSAMPGARRGSSWRAPSGHMARGSHMCDPYRVGGQRKTTGTGRAGTAPSRRYAPCLAHVGARHGAPAGRTCATPTGLADEGEPPEPAFTCVYRNSAMPGTRRGSPRRAPSGHMARGSHMCDPYGVGGQRKTTGTGIHVRVPEQRRAKEKHRNRHTWLLRPNRESGAVAR